ncbi:hypothetical protein [Holospora curviuscula]|nr:hypothetical protein [Holospora curviuscula]
MSSTLEEIILLTSFLEILTCWVKEMFLNNIPENRGILMDTVKVKLCRK